MSFALAQYRQARVQTASPVRIVVQLYDAAIRFMQAGAEAISQNDPSARGNNFRKAHAVVSELLATLDNEKAPELCAELERLYDFVLHQIQQAQIKNDPELVPPAVKVMTQLRSAWAELAEKTA